jgi:hypothetical protein
MTLADGSFQARFKVKWEDLCQHPGALHIAFGDRGEEHELLVAAHLLPILVTPPSSASSTSLDTDSHSQTRSMKSFAERELPTAPPTTIRISITHSPVRVISDIDDTIKLSNILSGARAVFHNVFVKDLQDNIIPGMGEWYSAMWSRGIRFHYVVSVPSSPPARAHHMCIVKRALRALTSAQRIPTNLTAPPRSCPHPFMHQQLNPNPIYRLHQAQVICRPFAFQWPPLSTCHPQARRRRRYSRCLPRLSILPNWRHWGARPGALCRVSTLLPPTVHIQ